MVVHDISGNVLCVIDEDNGLIDVKYKEFQSKVPLAVGDVYTILKKGIATNIYRLSEKEYEVKTLVKADLDKKRSKPL